MAVGTRPAARVRSPTPAGRLRTRVADHLIVTWPEEARGPLEQAALHRERVRRWLDHEAARRLPPHEEPPRHSP